MNSLAYHFSIPLEMAVPKKPPPLGLTPTFPTFHLVYSECYRLALFCYGSSCLNSDAICSDAGLRSKLRIVMFTNSLICVLSLRLDCLN